MSLASVPGGSSREGLLVKRGRMRKSWLQRHFTLNGSELVYFTKKGGKKKGDLSVADASIEPVSEASIGRPHTIEIVTGERTLYVQAKSSADQAGWLKALRAGSLKHVRASAAAAAGGGEEEEENKFNTLPTAVVIAGTIVCGSEVKVLAKPSDLSSLTVAWFSTAATIETGNSDAALSAEDFVPGANLETYVIRDADVGRRIGCVIKDKPGSGHSGVRVAVARSIVEALNEDEVTVRISLRPHAHNKYCDRKEKVCTAIGRYREAEVLEALLRGPASDLSKYRCRWYRSQVVTAEDLQPSAAKAAVGAAGPAEAAETGAGPATAATDATPAGGEADAPAAAAAAGAGGAAGAGAGAGGAGAASEVTEELGLDYSKLEWEAVACRPLSCLPPLPPAHEPSGPPVARKNEGIKVSSNFSFVYPLLKDDAGRFLKCQLVGRLEHPDMPVIDAPPVGPIEAAPPKARELWVEGEQRVGHLLVVKSYYFGGVEGNSEYWWLRITPEGDRADISEPSPCDITKPLPDPSVGPGPADADPRVYRLTDADAGCCIKVVCRPTRSDGETGYPTTSRPTRPIKERDGSEPAAAVATAEAETATPAGDEPAAAPSSATEADAAAADAASDSAAAEAPASAADAAPAADATTGAPDTAAAPEPAAVAPPPPASTEG